MDINNAISFSNKKQNAYEHEISLLNLILSFENEKVTYEAFDLMFNLLEDVANEYFMNLIKSPNILYVILSLAEKAEDDIKSKALTNLNNLLKSSKQIRHYAKDHEWLTFILSTLTQYKNTIILDLLFHIIQTLIIQNINVKQVIMLFALLQYEDDEFKSYYWTHILELLHNVWNVRHLSPNSFFDFITQDAGIILPPLKLSSNGHSFICWIKLDETSSLDKIFTLFSYKSESLTFGVTAVFDQNYLKLVTSDKKNKQESKRFNYPFRENKWYFIVLTYYTQRLKQGEYTLYVNGALEQSIRLSLPKFDKTMQECRIGMSCDPHDPINTMECQIGGMCFIDNALSTDGTLALYKRGINLFSSKEYIERVLLNQKSVLINKKTYIISMYVPLATNNDMCIDVSSGSPEKRAIKLSGVREFNSVGIHESLSSLGGIHLLLPLFSNKIRPKIGNTSNINDKVMLLIIELLKDNKYFQNQIRKGPFFDIMGLLLSSNATSDKQQNTQAWTLSSFDIISQLCNIVKTWKFDHDDNNNGLLKNLIENIILNFEMWCTSEPEIQKKFYSSITSLDKDILNIIQDILTVPQLISVLSEYYSYNNEKDHIKQVFNPLDESTHSSLLEIRSTILSLVQFLIKDYPTRSQISCIISYLYNEVERKNHEISLTTDVLNLLLTLITQSIHDKRFLDQCIDDNIIDDLFHLLKFKQEKHRAIVLKIIGIFLSNEQYSKNMRTYSLLIEKYLEDYSLTAKEYMSLMDIASGSVFSDRKINLEKSRKIQPDIFYTLLKLTQNKDDPILSIILMKDICKLCTESPEYGYIIAKDTYQWEKLFIDTVLLHPKSFNSKILKKITANNSQADVSNNLFDIVTEAFSLLIISCVIVRNGFKEIEKVLVNIHRYPFLKSSKKHAIIKIILFKVLKHILNSKFILSSSLKSFHLRNILSIVSFIEFTLFKVVSNDIDRFGLIPIRKHNMKGDNSYLIRIKLSQLSLDVLNQIFELAMKIKSHDVHINEFKLATETSIRRLAVRIVLNCITDCISIKLKEDFLVNKEILEEFRVKLSPFTISEKMQIVSQMYIRKKTKEVDTDIDIDITIDRIFNEFCKIFESTNSFSLRLLLLSGLKVNISTLLNDSDKNSNAFKFLYEPLTKIWRNCYKIIRSSSTSDPEVIKGFSEIDKLSIDDILFNVETNYIPELTNLFLISKDYIYKDEFSSIRQWKTHLDELIRQFDEDDKNYNELLSYVKAYVENRKVIVGTYLKEFEKITRDYRIKLQLHYSSVASEWKRINRLLLSSRGPWSKGLKNDDRFFWKIDSSETPNRMRVILKRIYGDVSYILNASKINDKKQLEMIEDSPLNQLKDHDNKDIDLKYVQSDGDDKEEINWYLNVDQLSETVKIQSKDGKSKEEKVLITEKCDYIKGLNCIEGEIEVTTNNIHFTSHDEKVFKTIPISSIIKTYPRRYLLEQSAIEIFLENKAYFFHIHNNKVKKIASTIVALKPELKPFFDPMYIEKQRQIATEKWRRRLISNFDYLMELNTYAGRTYCDISQYPVFPWVIADYNSKKLNLNDPSIYRDLTKPIGALNPERLKKFLERWELMDNSSPKFLYGSHFSSAAIVMFYLCRLEPFTTYSLKQQGDHFDYAVRMFWSIPETWKNCLNNQNDVKELIPEFFYLPDFLRNPNGLNFGTLRDGHSINEVVLPPWANSPEMFVKINRLALESEYVSNNLHHWIDLIFGYKQRGQASIDALNVFYYLTYENSVQWDRVDESLHQALKSQIREFGQTPSQLFKSPHPARLPLDQKIDIFNPRISLYGSSKLNLRSIDNFSFHQYRSKSENDCAIIFIGVDHDNDKIVLVFKDCLVLSISVKLPMKGTNDGLILIPHVQEQEILSSTQKKKECTLDLLFSPYYDNRDIISCFSLSKDGKYIFHAGSWDRTFSISSVIGCHVYKKIAEHKDVVRCISISQDGKTLVTASSDCNIMIWDAELILNPKKREKLFLSPRKTFIGHEDRINCVVVDSFFNIIITASSDYSCCIFNLFSGDLIRQISFDSPIDKVCLSKYGEIVSYSYDSETIYIHSINGILLNKVSNVGKINCMKISRKSDLLITGGYSALTIRSLIDHSLNIIYQRKNCPPIETIEIYGDDEYLLLGLSDGTLITTSFGNLQ